MQDWQTVKIANFVLFVKNPDRTIIGEINGSDALTTRTCLRGRKLGRNGHRADCDVNFGIQSMFDTRWEFRLATVSSKSGMTGLSFPI